MEANPGITAKAIAELARVGAWITGNIPEVAQAVATSTGMALAPTERAMRRYPFQVLPMTDAYAQAQQEIPDRFHRLGVIPAKIRIADQVWRHGA